MPKVQHPTKPYQLCFYLDDLLEHKRVIQTISRPFDHEGVELIKSRWVPGDPSTLVEFRTDRLQVVEKWANWTPARLKIHYAKVTPVERDSYFPIDMLRYGHGCCLVDARIRIQTYEGEDFPPRFHPGEKIDMFYVDNKAAADWVDERWRSFGWQVEEGITKPLGWADER